MEQTNKELYYTPDIGELHIGFECELDTGWGIVAFTPVTINIKNAYILVAQDLNRIRVKYLDKEDIESLGWVYDGNTYLGDEFTLRNHDLILEEKLLIKTNNTIIFYGIIKNKSELSKLMKQLNII